MHESIFMESHNIQLSCYSDLLHAHTKYVLQALITSFRHEDESQGTAYELKRPR